MEASVNFHVNTLNVGINVWEHNTLSNLRLHTTLRDNLDTLKNGLKWLLIVNNNIDLENNQRTSDGNNFRIQYTG